MKTRIIIYLQVLACFLISFRLIGKTAQVVTDTLPVVYGLPTLICPSDLTVNNDAGDCEALVRFSVSTIGFPAPALSYSKSSGSKFQIGTTTVVVKAKNIFGNSQCSFKVKVRDNEKPDISKMPADIFQTVDNGCYATVYWSLPKATDNCSRVKLKSDHNSGDQFKTGTTKVTYTATDAHGNDRKESFNIKITDNISPYLLGMPTDIIQDNDSGKCSAMVFWVEPTGEDNCLGTRLKANHKSGEVFPVGSTIVTYIVTDNSGNTDNASFTITVNDTEMPIITGMPANILQSNDSGICSAAINWILPKASDNCPGVTLISDYMQGAVFPVGTTVVTYTATDVHGNNRKLNFKIIVGDTETPVITGLPEDIVQPNDKGLCSAIVNWALPGVHDNCPGAKVTSNSKPGDRFPAIGATRVSYTAKDASGHGVSESFNITVRDTSLPVVLCKNIVVPLDSEGKVIIGIEDIENGISDNCSILSKRISKSNFDYTNLGDNQVKLTVKDLNDSSSCIAIVKIVGGMLGVKMANSESRENFKIYPNPSQGEITLELNINKGKSATAKIFNPEGELVYEQQLFTSNGEIKKTISVKSFSNGIYFMTIYTSEDVTHKKFSIDK